MTEKINYPYLPAGKEILYVGLDNGFMAAARDICKDSGCAKQPTGAVLVKDGQIIGRGSNAAKSVDVCPRL
jgi:deoxycytidylate deaminase